MHGFEILLGSVVSNYIYWTFSLSQILFNLINYNLNYITKVLSVQKYSSKMISSLSFVQKSVNVFTELIVSYNVLLNTAIFVHQCIYLNRGNKNHITLYVLFSFLFPHPHIFTVQLSTYQVVIIHIINLLYHCLLEWFSLY